MILRKMQTSEMENSHWLNSLTILHYQHGLLAGYCSLALGFTVFNCSATPQVAEGWSREQKDKCLDETEKAFSVSMVCCSRALAQWLP